MRMKRRRKKEKKKYKNGKIILYIQMMENGWLIFVFYWENSKLQWVT